MRTVVKENETYEENGEFHTHKRSEVIVDDGTVEKDFSVSPTGINLKYKYTKGKAWHYHYETNNPDVFIPAFIIASLVCIIIGVVILILSIKYNSKFMIVWSCCWLIFVAVFIEENIRKNLSKWIKYYKDKRENK